MTAALPTLVVGDVVEDIVIWGVRQIEHGTDTPASIYRAQGGSAANVAVALARTGAAVRFIGRVGDDLAGPALERALTRYGVDARLQHGGTTGTIVLLIDADGERTMLTDRGASGELESIDPAALDGVGWLHIPVYGLAGPGQAEVFRNLCADAARRSVPVSFDMSSVSVLRELGRDSVQHLVTRAHPAVIFANADEADFLELDNWPVADEQSIIVKHGADPVVARTTRGSQSHPVPPVADVRDTTGAGDAFAAGFIAELRVSDDIASAIAAGNAVAARVISEPGAGWA